MRQADRYYAQILLDESSLLVRAAYVDLNPIRAALTATPETSDYAGAKDRIKRQRMNKVSSYVRQNVDFTVWRR